MSGRFAQTIRWRQVLLWLVVILPGVPFAIGSLALVGYIYLPRPYWDLEIPVLDASTSEILLSAHGVHDTPQSWSGPLREIQQEKFPGAAVISLDWSHYSRSTFRCSVDGARIGKKIGRLLGTLPALRTVHLVGHSCGSFVVLNVCRSIKALQPNVRVQTTYLDPVSIYGGFFWEYGIENFGSCADFSEAYIDTGDGVPGSNQLIPHTHTFDVTDKRLASGSSVNPHVWPTIYYMNLVKEDFAPSILSSDNLVERYPSGVLERVKAKSTDHQQSPTWN